MVYSQQGQRLVIVLFECRKQVPAHLLNIADNFLGFFHHHLETVIRQRGGCVGQGFADRNSARLCLYKHRGVDGWCEQGKSPLYAFDVQAVADFIKPVGHGIPVAHQGLVARHVEIEHHACSIGQLHGLARKQTLRRLLFAALAGEHGVLVCNKGIVHHIVAVI